MTPTRTRMYAPRRWNVATASDRAVELGHALGTTSVTAQILINRGFVPYDLKDAAKRAKGQVTGKVTVTGLARNPLPAKPSIMLPDNDVAKNIFYWKDRDVMAASAGLPAWEAESRFSSRSDENVELSKATTGSPALTIVPSLASQRMVSWNELVRGTLRDSPLSAASSPERINRCRNEPRCATSPDSRPACAWAPSPEQPASRATHARQARRRQREADRVPIIR